MLEQILMEKLFFLDPSDQKPVNYLLVSVAENKKYQFFLSRAIRRWNFKGGKQY